MTAARRAFVGAALGTILALGAGVVVAFVRGQAAPEAGTPVSHAATVAVAEDQTFTPRVLSTGSIRLLPGARIEVGARVSGVVVSLSVTQGSRVERGAIIAQIDDRDARARLVQADAAVAEMQAAVRQQEEDAGRVETLATADGATAQELLAARTALATARARLQGARAAQVLAQLQLDYTLIRAPIAGLVTSVTTHEGETVSASLAAPTFVTLIDPVRIECVALVDESDVGRVQLGDSAEFTVDAYPGRTFRGAVVGIAPDATVIGGVVDYEVRVRIIGSTRDLKPQMTASVSISGAPERSLVIPTAAIRQSALGAYVWRRRGGAPERVVVVLGMRQSDISEVRSGLARGDTVLTDGFPGEQ
jgi:HlyD family secretion protein